MVGLFADAEGGEDGGEDVFRVEFSGDFAEGIEGFAEVDGGQFGAGGVFC